MMDSKQSKIAKLVTDNQGFVVAMARKFAGQGVDLSDLVSEGNLGLIEAAERFDDTQKNSFVAYAAAFVVKKMRQALNTQGTLYKIPRAEDSNAERKRAKSRSLDAPLRNNSSASLLHVVVDGSAMQADETMQQSQDHAALLQAIDRLDERERAVVSAFYGIGSERLTMAEIAQQMGLKRERVRQIRDVAVRKLHRLRHQLQ